MKTSNIVVQIVLSGLLLALHMNTVYAAQEKYEGFSWESPNGWEGAVFDVPTWFAKDMRYSGREVIRFHDGFYDENSSGFWTYAFALLIEQSDEDAGAPTTVALIDETRRYFIGLARVLGDNKNENYPADKIKVRAKSNWVVSDNGMHRSQLYELIIFDSFTTGKVIKLNAKISTWLCSDKHRAIHYSISPHEIKHPLWGELDKEVDALECW